MKLHYAILSLLTSSQIVLANPKGEETAYFAGGCFWCMEQAFEEIEGVTQAVSGYMNGHKKDPTYKEVSAGITGHTEAIEVRFDPKVISYNELLKVFWKNVDPTVKDKQFCDTGSQYRAGIYPVNADQKNSALASFDKIKKLFKVVHTELEGAEKFYPAENYHQDYYKKNPIRYKYYKFSCGRQSTLDNIWKGKAI